MTRVIRLFVIVAGIHDNEISAAKSKVHVRCAVPDGRTKLNGIYFGIHFWN